MHKPTPTVVEALTQLLNCLDAVEPDRAGGLRMELHGALQAKHPDLTLVLLRGTRKALAHNLVLGRVLTAAASRAACTLLGERHPGATIEVRVPPHAAVQIGFGSGPRHTRGTPPNVVEFGPEDFLRLATGLASWDQTSAQVSGSHAEEARQAFPLIDG